MTYSELRQTVQNIKFLATQPGLSDHAEYAASADLLNTQIAQYLAPDAPAFDNQALGLVLESLSQLRHVLSGIQGKKPQTVRNAEAQLGDIENLFSQVDVTKGSTLAACVDDLNPRTVRVSGKVDTMGGQASSRNMLKRTTSDGQELSGFFTEETLLFESTPELTDAFYSAKNAHPGDRKFQDFCTQVERSPYGLRALALSMDESFGKNKILQYDDEEIPKKAFFPERLAQYGLLPNDNDDPYNAFDELLANPNIHELLFAVRQTVSDDELKAASLENQRYGLVPYNGLNAESGSSMTGRNVAMSRVANLLGISPIVARSTPIAVERDGVTTRGVFMEKAEGLDYPKHEKEIPSTPFIDLPPDAFDGEGLKSVADLQVLDFLCQNVDRHQNNMLYAFENGKLKNVTGIDHDLAFGTVEYDDNIGIQNGAALDELGVISESAANAVRRMNPEMLTNALRDTGLKNGEITAACKRLEKLQTRLATATPFLEGDKAELGKLKIVSDAEWKQMELAKLALKDISQNTFSMVRGIKNAIQHQRAELAKESAAPAKAKAEPKVYAESMAVDELAPSRLHEYQADVSALNDTLKTTQGLFHGSNQQYKDMRDALDRFVKLDIDAGRPLTEPEQLAYYDALSEANEAVRAYVAYKTARADTGHTAETRLSTARELQSLLSSHLDNYREAMHAKQEAELAKVDQELREEQRKFDAIVDSLTQSICAKQKDADPAQIRNTVKLGGTLKDMVHDTNELEHMYKLSQEKPGELYKAYGKALSNAAGVATARNREPASAPQAANRQAGQNSSVLPGGRIK